MTPATHTYRVFTDDRGPGLYSALFELKARDAHQAVSRVQDRTRAFWANQGRPTRYRAIEWPPTTRESLAFLRECVEREN